MKGLRILVVLAAFGARGALATPADTPVATSAPPNAPAPVIAPAARAAITDRLPLSFVPNVGQYAARTRFVGQAPGATVRFESGAVTYDFQRAMRSPESGAAAADHRPGAASLRRESLRVRATFPGANSAPRITGEAPAAHPSHFYLGNDPARWRTSVPSFGAVRIHDLYPGIDLEYHGTGRELEYDFHVAPGADPRRIRVRYDGVERLAVTESGELEVTTRFGRSRESAPVAWQTIGGGRREVRARYRLVDARTFAFAVDGPLDPEAPLVIDPVLKYSTYLGGISYDEVHEIVSDIAGNAWVVGGTLSPDYPATGSPVPGTEYSVFLTKIAPSGSSLVYSVFLGGSSTQIGYGLRVDAAGNATIAGITGSNDFPTTTGAYDVSFNGTNPGEADLFVSRFSPAGTLTYSTYLGGPNSDWGGRLVLNSLGWVYVLANAGANYPTTAGAYDVTYNGLNDVVVSGLNLAGGGASDLVYSTYLGGSADDEAYDIDVDNADHLYIAGSTRSNDFPATGGPPFNGTFDAVVAKLKPLGAGAADLAYATKYGGTQQDYGGGVAVDGTGQVCFSGSTASANFSPATGYQNTYGGGLYDGFVIKLMYDGTTVIFSTFLGSTGEDRCGDVAMDPSWNPVVVGSTDSPGFPITGASYDPTYNGGVDIFLATFDPLGLLLESTFLGGSGNDHPYALDIDTGGRQFVTGNTQSADYPTTAGAYDLTYGGGAIDAVVTKFATMSPDTCQGCDSPADTCCAVRPPLTGVENPISSSNVLVGTRQALASAPYAVTIYDLGSPLPSPLEDTDWALMMRFHGPGNSWNEDSLGTVFGLTVDRFGNIFVTHTSCYDFDKIAQVFGAAPGAVYRIDGATGVITTFCVLPQAPDGSITPGENWPGLGNITYDCRHDQFFVTNLEDGRIYRIKANGVNGPTGTVQETFDPLTPDDNQPGWAPIGERLWGVQIHGDRVYYGVWADDITASNPAVWNAVRSVKLLPGGAFDTGAGSDRHELFVPSLPFHAFSNPVSDISFSEAGKMLLGERGVLGLTYPTAHVARALEYQCVAGCWLPANHFGIGQLGSDNSAGGVDYDRDFYSGAQLGRVWVTGDALHFNANPYTDVIYGLQGFRPSGGSILNSMLIDAEGNTVFTEKNNLGDVEAPGCPDSTVGSLCGRKFHDLDRDGVKDSGEPAIAGWTLVLQGPGGPYYTTTDGQGNYCFTVPVGSYVVGEVGQVGWVQTAPATGTYNVTVSSGQVVTGKDFGNYACGAGSPCVTAPPSMAAWWRFDETAGSTSASDATHLAPPKNVAQLAGGAAITTGGHRGNQICMGGELDYAVVPIANQMGLDFGAGSFGIDAWVNMSPGGGAMRMLAERRVLVSLTPYRTRGWALYFNGLQAFLEIGIGISTQIVPGPTVTVSTWQHLAVSVDRSAGQGRWYLNGAPMPAFNFVPTPGSLNGNADLHMGRTSPAFPLGSSFEGCVDDLEIFSSPLAIALTAQTVQALYAAGTEGKCPDVIRLPEVTTICQTQDSVSVCFTLCNTVNATQSYHWSLAGLLAGPGCTVAGPIAFIPSSGTVTLGPGACSAPICVTIPRPAGLTAQNATSCYQLTVVNDSTGRCTSRQGKIRADNSCWCAGGKQTGLVSIPARLPVGMIGIPIEWNVSNPCGGGTALPYRIVAAYEPLEHEDPLAVSLNGLPPGEPVIGDLSLGPGGEPAAVTVLVSTPNGYDLAALYEIVLEADTDGDGQYERVASTQIVSTYEDDGTTDVPGVETFADAVRLVTQPNPFFRGATIGFSLSRAEDVTLAVYDLTGRRVRELHRGKLAAGPQHVEWNGRDRLGREVGAGVYFVRLDSPRLRLIGKIVKLR